MRFKLILLILAFIPMQLVLGFNNAQLSQNMLEEGRSKYEYLQQMSEMPHYGSCWKSAVAHVENGCRALSEDTQSDIALHITNCFLEMSGHEVYNCELDKKPNLRKICIASMTDRAFNVYTEFFTHTQNICWFLRGQVWYESLIENTLLVNQQLKEYAQNQEDILKSQKESLLLQESLLKYSLNAENIMKEFQVSATLHHETLSLVAKSLSGLQSWLIGELSWFDMIVFYIVAVVLIGVFTSVSRTASSRFPILCLLIANAVVERLICKSLLLNDVTDAHLLHERVYKYIWWTRQIFIIVAFAMLLYTAITFEDLDRVNNTLLQRIYEQNVKTAKNIERLLSKKESNNDVFYYENSNDAVSDNISNIGCTENSVFEISELVNKSSVLIKHDNESSTKKNNVSSKSYINRRKTAPLPELHNTNSSCKYNLRRKQSTPVS